MATLAEFQTALGRPVSWGFASPAHQLKIAPHAFADANAYYSRESESLSFGYFTGDSGANVFTCLSHDIVAHETAHALLDGLRAFFLRPSHADQAAFHEGFRRPRCAVLGVQVDRVGGTRSRGHLRPRRT